MQTTLVALWLAAAAGALPAGAAASAPAPGAAGADARAVLAAMEQAAAALRDYTLLLVRQERLEGKLSPRETIVVKWARPQKSYVRFVEPHEGREALFVRGWNGDRLRVHKGSFPDVNLNIDPKGNLAMSGSHHAASEGSLVHFVDLVMAGVRKAESRGEGSARLVGEETLFGRPCDRVDLTSPAGGVEDRVRPRETLWDVARRHGADMYGVLHHNLDRGFRKPTSPRAGDVVFVPHYYAGRVVLWIDRELHLPLKAEIYDHDGQLYEYYEHRDLRVNVGLGDADFDPENPAYDF